MTIDLEQERENALNDGFPSGNVSFFKEAVSDVTSRLGSGLIEFQSQ